jgi:hypothetical protein
MSMFCPECGLEDHEEGSSHCVDCEVVLAEDPSGEDAPVEEEVEFVRLMEVSDVEEFAAMTSQLEEEGIPWFVQSDGALAMIYVAENRLDEARKLGAAILAGVSSRE